MNGSPFAVFRRNQRQLMVVVTGLAMFSFIFLDAAMTRSGQLPVSLTVLAVALLCAGGMWVVGAPRGKGGELALYGALIGAVVAFFAVRAQGFAPVVTTNQGSYQRTDLQRLAQRRSVANRFVIRASSRGQQGFGDVGDRALVLRQLLLAEARKMNVTISDDAVLEFIKQISGDKLAKSDYDKILRELQIGESQLFDILKEELAAQTVLMLDVPPRDRTTGAAVQTPLTYWKQFRMLQVKQSLDAAALPVEQFVSLVPEPKDDELRVFFERFKSRMPTADGKPGFLQERQVQLAYVAADFEVFEKQTPEPTPSEIAEYYSLNKDRYRELDLPDLPSLPTMPGMPERSEEQSPPSALLPENRVVEPVQPKDKPPEDRPPAPGAPENGAAALESQATDTALASSINDACGLTSEIEGFELAGQTTTASAQKSPTGDENSNPSPASEKAAASEDEPILPPLPASAPVAPPGPHEMIPPGPTTAPKYRELDDVLRGEIRDTMLKERAFAKMGEAVDRALEHMLNNAAVYQRADTQEQKAKAEIQLQDQLKRFATENGLEYGETKSLSQRDLVNLREPPLGGATDPSSGQSSRSLTVAEMAFESEVLYNPLRADAALRDKRFAFWKTADHPAKVPDFRDVKEKVAEAWKFEQARPLAEKRAQALAELVRTSQKPMVDALSGQTITGKEDGPPLTVRHTPRFSWLNLPITIPRSLWGRVPPEYFVPRLSLVEGIDEPGMAFMRTVFEELGPGETGIAPNQPLTTYFVVQVKQRDATPTEGDDNLGLRALQSQFMNDGNRYSDSVRPLFGDGSPYAPMAQAFQAEVDSRWRDGFERRFGIEWHNEDSSAPRELEQ